MSTKRNDAVLFDLGNTLVSYYQSADFQPILERCVAAVAEAMTGNGRSLDVEAATNRAKELNREQSDGRVWPLADRLRLLVASSEQALPESLIDELITAFLGPIFDLGELDAEALPVLRRVRELGLKSAIVSNTPWGSPAGRWKEELRRWDLLQAVDEAVFCVDVGWRKPAPAVFEHALSLLDVRPDRALFVGDDVRWDVEGARQAGLTPILLAKSNGDGAEDVTVIHSLGELPRLLAG